MRLEQHIYTSGKKGFSTVAVTSGISKNEIIKLEKNSLYILPGALINKEESTPTKYIFYPLDETRFVIGRAISTGKDNLGRAGNYFFHNFIIEKKDLISFDLNPIKLIKYLHEKNFFIDEIQDDNLNALEFFFNDSNKSELRVSSVEKEIILKLLYFCFYNESLHYPLILIGTDKERIDFLDWLYNILPYSLREKLSFDTYSYGANLGFQIIGIPDGVEFQQSILYSLKLNLALQQYTSNFEPKEPSNLLRFNVEMASLGQVDEINALHYLTYCLQNNDYTRFKEGYKNISKIVKDHIYTSYKEIIINHIINKKDQELLQIITDRITVNDMNRLSSVPDIFQRFVETGDNEIQKIFVDWLYIQENRTHFYPILFKSSSLLIIFLEKIKNKPYDMTLLLELYKVLREHYSQQTEQALAYKTIETIQDIKLEKKIAKDFTQALNNLPMQELEHISLLRTIVKYELSDDPILLKKIIDNISIFSGDFQVIILSPILRGVIEFNRLEEIALQLCKLFDHIQNKKEFILKLITLTEKPEISDKMRKVLKEIILELIKKLPPDEITEIIKNRIEKLPEQNPSFFEKLFGRRI